MSCPDAPDQSALGNASAESRGLLPSPDGADARNAADVSVLSLTCIRTLSHPDDDRPVPGARYRIEAMAEPFRAA